METEQIDHHEDTLESQLTPDAHFWLDQALGAIAFRLKRLQEPSDLSEKEQVIAHRVSEIRGLVFDLIALHNPEGENRNIPLMDPEHVIRYLHATVSTAHKTDLMSDESLIGLIRSKASKDIVRRGVKELIEDDFHDDDIVNTLMAQFGLELAPDVIAILRAMAQLHVVLYPNNWRDYMRTIIEDIAKAKHRQYLATTLLRHLEKLQEDYFRMQTENIQDDSLLSSLQGVYRMSKGKPECYKVLSALFDAIDGLSFDEAQALVEMEYWYLEGGLAREYEDVLKEYLTQVAPLEDSGERKSFLLSKMRSDQGRAEFFLNHHLQFLQDGLSLQVIYKLWEIYDALEKHSGGTSFEEVMKHLQLVPHDDLRIKYLEAEIGIVSLGLSDELSEKVRQLYGVGRDYIQRLQKMNPSKHEAFIEKKSRKHLT